ncbi:MAG: hypothetical protein ACYC9O_03045 [Candidatus Latescibacterota bacterium]
MIISILLLVSALFLFSPGTSIAADPGDSKKGVTDTLSLDKKTENIRAGSPCKGEVRIISDSELSDMRKKKSPVSEDVFCTCMPTVKPAIGGGLSIKTIKPDPDVAFTLHVKKLHIIPNSASKQNTVSKE